MADPTNLSLKGIVTWSQTETGQGEHPVNVPSTGQGPAINADKVDGYHASEIVALAVASGGGGCVARGSSTFAGNGGGRTITFIPNLGNTNYSVVITPSADTNSREGEYWVVKTDGANFSVYNDGSGTSAFEWAVMVKGTLPANSVLNDLLDVTVSGPATNQVLKYNGSQWVNGTDSSGAVTSVSGSGSGISVSPTTGGVVVQNTGVTSLTAGTGISLNASSGSVTITNSAPAGSAPVGTDNVRVGAVGGTGRVFMTGWPTGTWSWIATGEQSTTPVYSSGTTNTTTGYFDLGGGTGGVYIAIRVSA